MRDMKTRQKTSALQIMERYRVALENASTQPEIAKQLTEIGYTPDVIQVGKDKYSTAMHAYNENKREDDETSEARQKFLNLKDLILGTYTIHRKKSKVIFKNDSLTLGKLALTGSMPEAYVEVVDTISKFYSTALSDNSIIDKLRMLAITPEQLQEASNNIKEMEKSRADYLREVGESQDATKIKDAALLDLSHWMSNFYAVAKIALEDRPQLLEALGLSVR